MPPSGGKHGTIGASSGTFSVAIRRSRSFAEAAELNWVYWKFLFFHMGSEGKRKAAEDTNEFIYIPRESEFMISIIADAIARLNDLRDDRANWSMCAYCETRNEERGSHDANELERHRFLIALQYNYTDADENLIRFLFDQEVLALQNDDFQGCGDAIRLASYLLSRFKRGDDFWRFADAKLANFDTACGYDSQFLLSSGIETALATFSRGDQPRQEHVRDDLL